LRTSGSAAPTGLPHDVIPQNRRAPLDKQGFAPLGKVITGMDVVERLYSAYGDMAPRGQGPDPSKIEVQGNTYLDAKFPRLDYIKKATIQ
jgi:peptidyl-prolyl cis-trans isomerase A (cyclophilin A)